MTPSETRPTDHADGDRGGRWPSWAPWLLAGLVALSRLLLLPDGPWEQDEAIFAAGVLDFSVTAHRPHPPGFPGWIALGKLVLPLVGDPLLALRLLSCAASVCMFVLGAVCLRRFVAAEIAWAAAAAHAFVPGVWFHAPRAFASTPALALLVLAIWLWSRPEPRRVALGFAVVAAAVLVRPQLLLVAGVILAAAIWYRRGMRRAVSVGLVGAASLVGIAVLVMVVDTGGLDPLLSATTEHLRRNERVARRFGGLDDIGIVRALGGVVPTVSVALAAAGGLCVWARRDRTSAIWIGATLVAAIVSILGMHPPQLPRYAIVVVACVVPPIAMLAQIVGRFTGSTVLLGVAVCGAWTTFGVMVAAHRTPLPVVAALRTLEAEPAAAGPLVHSHGLFSFVRLAHMQGRLRRRPIDEVALARGAVDLDGPYDLLGGSRRALPGATVQEQVFEAFPEVAWDLSQRRFHRVHLLRRPVFVEAPIRSLEHDRNAEPFVWLAPVSQIRAQPGADRIVLAMLVDQKLAPLDVETRVGDDIGPSLRLEPGLQTVTIDLRGCPGPCVVELRFSRELEVTRDRRSLTARLYGAWCEGASFDVPPFTFSPGRPREAAAHGVTLEGFFAPERFTPEQRPGAWTNGRAKMRWRGGAGRVTVTLAQPPPRDAIVKLRTSAGTHEVAVGATPSEHTLEIADDAGILSLEIEGEALAPSSYAPSSNDERALGPIILSVRHEPFAGKSGSSRP